MDILTGFPFTIEEKGKLKNKKVDISGAEYIIKWFRERMHEYGSTAPCNIQNRILLVKAETGAGKSFALPVYLLRLLRGTNIPEDKKEENKPGVVSVQPRILTTRSTAENQGKHKKLPDLVLGNTVGYITSSGSVFPKSSINLLYITIGSFWNDLQKIIDSKENLSSKYRFIILDEIHDETGQLSLVLSYLKKIYTTQKNLPFLILTSATMDIEKLTEFFELTKNNVVEIGGRMHEITDYYPTEEPGLIEDEVVKKLEWIEDIKDDSEIKDVMVFLPTQQMIDIVAKTITKNKSLKNLLILKLTSSIVKEASEDFRLIHASRKNISRDYSRKVILSTNVAESGITISTIKYVIDSGMQQTNVSFYPENIQSLIVTAITKTNLEQRRGRAGRVSPGIYFPIFTKKVLNKMEKNQKPDFIRSGFKSGELPLLMKLTDNKIEFDDEKKELQLITVSKIPGLNIATAIEELILSGLAVKKDSIELTKLGILASKLVTIDSEYTLNISTVAFMLNAFARKCAGSDIVGIAAVLELMPYIPLTTETYRGKIPIQTFIILLSDSILETFCVLENFVDRLLENEDKFYNWLKEYKDVKWKPNKTINMVKSYVEVRTNIMRTLIKNGINPFISKNSLFEYKIGVHLTNYVIKLKNALVSSKKTNICSVRDKIITRHGLFVNHHKFIDRIRKLVKFDYTWNPKQIWTPNIELTETKSKTLLYEFRTEHISILDGYVGYNKKIQKVK